MNPLRCSLTSWILCLAASIAGCGSEFQSSSGATAAGGGDGAAGAGGSGAGDAGAGGTGGGNGGAGGDGNGGGGITVCDSGSAAGNILLWTTLNDPTAITTPKVGSGTDAMFATSPADDFVPALVGSGLQIDDAGEWVRFRQVDADLPQINLEQGAIDFCYRPAYEHTDGMDHALFAVTALPGYIRIRKAAASNGNVLQVSFSNGNSLLNASIPSASYELTPGTWCRITISWDFTVALGEPRIRMYLNGTQLEDPTPSTGPYLMPPPSVDGFMYIGAFSETGSPTWNALGVIDEFVIYNSAVTP